MRQSRVGVGTWMDPLMCPPMWSLSRTSITARVLDGESGYARMREARFERERWWRDARVMEDMGGN